jgi:hypothetical protein
MEVRRGSDSRVRTGTLSLIKLSISFDVILELLILTEKELNSLFKALLSINSIVFLVLKI